MILITGAGGKTGRVLTREISNAEPVCALVHREEQVEVLMSLGAARAVTGDMRDKATLRAALEGVRAVYHICPNMSPDEVEIGKSVLEEARKAGLEHFVYHSVLHPQTEKMNHHWQKLRVEEMLFESGLPFTILQPAPYMQNLLAGWKSIAEEGLLRVPYAVQARFSFIDLVDLAAAARIVLLDSSHQNAVYELAGTTPISHVEVAEVFGSVLEREVRADKQEIRDWRLRASSLSQYERDHLAKMFEYYDRWGLAGNPNVLRWVLMREPTALESFARRILKEQNANH